MLAVRRPIEIGNPLLFFAMVVALFPLGLGPAPDQLAGFAPGILWIIALLSNLLTSDAVFRSDFDDGSLEQLLLSPQPLYLSVLAYIGAHWLITGLLLALVSPVFALMLNLPAPAWQPGGQPVAGHRRAEPAGLYRRGADRGPEARRHADLPVDPAAVYAGADFRQRRGAGGGTGAPAGPTWPSWAPCCAWR